MHRHKWLKWSELSDGYNGNKLQFRACAECGKVQRRNIGYCDGVKSLAANAALSATGFEPGPTPPQHPPAPH
jgi:hypothetical protein